MAHNMYTAIEFHVRLVPSWPGDCFSNAFRLQNRMTTTLLLMGLGAPVLSFLIYLLNSTFTCDSIPTCSKRAHFDCQPIPAASASCDVVSLENTVNNRKTDNPVTNPIS